MAEEVKRIRAVFETDVSKYNSSLNGINKQMKLAKSETKLAQRELKDFGNSTDGVAKVQEKLNKQIELHNKKIDLYSDKLNKAKNKISENVSKRDELNRKIVDAEKALSNAEKAHGKESDAAKKAKEELDKLKGEYNKNEKAIENNIKRVADYESTINNTEVEIKNLQSAIENNNKALLEQSNKLKQTSDILDKFGNKAQSMGDGINNISDKILGLSASMAAIIGVSAKMSMDFEQDIANINTLLDDTRNLDKYKNKILELSKTTGIELNIVSSGMYQAISSLGDLGEETNGIFEIMTKGAKAGGAEVSDAVSLISAAMKGYGSVNAETANKISDLAFQTAKLGVTTFPEMAKSMQPLFPLASTLNISLEDLFGSMATLTGVTGNTAEVSTQLKAVFSNLIKPTTEMQKVIKKYGFQNGQAMIESKGFSGVLKILQKETGGSSDKMGKLFSSTEALTAILALTGEQYTTFIDKSGQMNKSLGATETALGKVEDTAGDRLNKSLNELKLSFINLGGAAAPIVEKISKAISKVAEVLENLDEETLETIVNVTAMGLAIGGTGKAIGSTVSTVGNLSKGLAGAIRMFSSTGSTAASITGSVLGANNALSTVASTTSTVGSAASIAGGASGMGGLVASLGKFVVGASPWLLAGAAVVGTAVAIDKSMSEEAIPAVDLFADHIEVTGSKMTSYGEQVTTTTTKISEETAKQVQAYLDLDEGAKYALNDLYYSSQVITDETVNGMAEKYASMGNVITTQLATDKANDLTIMQGFFEASSIMTEEQEAKMLEKMQKGYDNKILEVEEKEARILEILTNAKNESRNLKESEVQEISQLQNQLRTNAINTLSTQEEEAKIILDRLKAYDTRVTAEQASEHIKNFNNQRDKAIDAANSEYREVKTTIENMRDNLKTISADQADELIKDAERQRDKTIEAAKDTRDQATKKIFSMNEELKDDVDTTTGDILTFWDKLQKKWDDWFPKKKTFSTETIETKTTINKTKNESGKSKLRLYDSLNSNMHKQLQRNIVQGLNVVSKTQDLQRIQRNNINLTPNFEGVVKIELNDGSIIKKNIKFIDKSLNKEKEIQSYGGLI